MFAIRARRGVENSRLGLDASKSKAKAASGGRGMNPDDEMVTEEFRAEIERKEDEFVGQTEEAVGVMKNVCFHFPPQLAGRHFPSFWGDFALQHRKPLILYIFRSSIPPSPCVTSLT